MAVNLPSPRAQPEGNVGYTFMLLIFSVPVVHVLKSQRPRILITFIITLLLHAGVLLRA